MLSGPALTSAERSLLSGALTLTADVFGFCKVCACMCVCAILSKRYDPQEVDVQHQWALDSFADLLGSAFKANMNLLRVCPSATCTS